MKLSILAEAQIALTGTSLYVKNMLTSEVMGKLNNIEYTYITMPSQVKYDARGHVPSLASAVEVCILAIDNSIELVNEASQTHQIASQIYQNIGILKDIKSELQSVMIDVNNMTMAHDDDVSIIIDKAREKRHHLNLLCEELRNIKLYQYVTQAF